MEKKSTKDVLKTFLRRLTNLSGRNKSLFLPKLYQEQFIDIHTLSFLNGKNSFSILQNLIAGKKSTLCAEIDSRVESNNVVSQKLKRLQRMDRFLFEERGSKDLHVGWPFVHGKFGDGTVVRGPLLFFPVDLEIQNHQWMLVPREGSEITFNKSFLLAYAFYNKVQVNETLLEEDFTDFEKDSTVFRTLLYQLLQKSNLELNFNPENFRDELVPFGEIKRDDFSKTVGTGQLKLMPEAVLGIFPQAGSSLVPDYLDLLDSEKITELEDLFYQDNSTAPSSDTNFLQEVREEKVYSIFPMDAWQENALKGVKMGHSLVVQGPPGTGKSQLICNLISDNIANGKRVLVVCQKRVAIDVVFNRLKEKRLDDFIGLVHDFRNDRKELFGKAARQIERIEEYKSKNNSLDAIQLERKFFNTSRRIDQICEELEAFKKILFDETEAGISVKELYVLSDPTQPSIELKQDLSLLKWTETDGFKRRLRSYVRMAARFLQDDYPWLIRKSMSEWTVKDLQAVRTALVTIHPWFNQVAKDAEALLGQPIGWEKCELYVEQIDLLRALKKISQAGYEHLQRMTSESEEETNALWLANMEKMMLECFEEEGPELTTPTAQLGQLQEALYRSMKSRRSLIGLIRWQLFSKDKFLITRTLVGNNLKSNGDGFRLLEKKLDRRLNLEHNLTKLRAQPWIVLTDNFLKADDVIQWFNKIQEAAEAKGIFLILKGLEGMINPARHTLKEFVSKITQLDKIIFPIIAQKEHWKQWLLNLQIEQLVSDATLGPRLDKVIAEDFDSLSDFDRNSESLQPHEKLVIDKLYNVLGQWDHQAFENTFLNSLALAWIEHIEFKHPELRIVSNGKIEEMEEELGELLAEKEAIGSDILLMRARERVTDSLEFNRLNNRVTYRDLNHQLTKKKKIWPIRKVVAEFEEELMRLIPCWLASPESVSSIFPMKPIFDLVIFDEASQCFAEQGIPALYRGSQCVVAGDQQQLQPSDLYQARWEEEEEENPDLESVSLLALGTRYLAEVGLHGHYRSQLPELIQFSNHHFYGGKLRLLPDRNKINEQSSAIEYMTVKGVWEDNCNLEEAAKVVEVIRSLQETSPDKEIGVITFNAPQQTLILDLLDKSEIEHGWKVPDSLFVKNIENVQGDERDIIIFSVGYARDKKGKVNAQFGSLNLSGGENRLNVAVTRAKEKIILITSISPEDLQVEETKNKGPKLLKAYLEYARESAIRKGPSPDYGIDKHPQAWYLKRVMKSEMNFDFSLEGNLPYCDFMVRKEGQYTALLLTDDDYYHESPSAKSSHGLVPRALRLKKWKFRMLYSRNHWINVEKFWNEIRKLAQ